MKLYAICDLGYVDREDIASVTDRLCAGGADLLQLRAKSYAVDDILAMARELRPICGEHGVPFIVNDFPEIAAEVGADGVHVGQDDGGLADARRRAGDCAIVGRSTHSLEQAGAAVAEGADYIGFGPLYPTATKPGRPAIGLDGVAEVHRRVATVPIYCIGGVSLRTLPAVAAAGALNVVIVSDLLQSDDIASYIRRAKALFADS